MGSAGTCLRSVADACFERTATRDSPRGALHWVPGSLRSVPDDADLALVLGNATDRCFFGNSALGRRLPLTMQDQAFADLVEAHYAPLYRFALSLARNPADASDLTQQTFFVWATKGESLRDAAKAKTWLFTTLYREFLRVRRRGGRISAIEDLPPNEKDLPDTEVDLVAKMDSQLVVAALQEIDPVFREPLTLFYLQDLAYHEIAEILDVPIGTVMSRLSRGKAHLRTRLAEKAQGGGIIEFPKTGTRP